MDEHSRPIGKVLVRLLDCEVSQNIFKNWSKYRLPICVEILNMDDARHRPHIHIVPCSSDSDFRRGI
jgi:hypothetical protein